MFLRVAASRVASAAAAAPVVRSTATPVLLGLRNQSTAALGEFAPDGPFETRLFINNEFVNATNGATFPTVNPATEEVIADVQAADSADVDIAVAAARDAFDNGEWSSMDASGRRNLLLKLVDLVDQNAEYLTMLESLDNGKNGANPGAYGAATDVFLVKECLSYYAGWADKCQGKTIPVNGGNLCYTRHEPVGVCAQIIPWNFPLLMLAWKLGPALATGCTTVVKTSEKTPLSALAFAKLIKEAGFPPGVVNILSGYGPDAGEPLALHDDVDKVAFTGSTAVGHKILRMSADSNMKKVTLELGGKSPLLVFPDADIDEAVAVADLGLFMNMGQACCASSRLFVHEDVYDEFVEKAAAKAAARTVANPHSPDCVQGPQVDQLQFDKIMGYINSGKDEGARLVTGGERVGDKGYFVAPTVFADVEDDMTIAREEIFGPVSSILKFSSTEEAIRRANDTVYGLAAGVVSRDVGTILSVANKLRAGTVWVNCWNALDTAAPFGGFKQSGLGRELGEYALENYTQVKTVVIPVDR